MRCRLSTRLLLALAAGLALGLTGCLERTGTVPPPMTAHSPVPVPHWSYVSRFGGKAELSTDSPDPYARRYTDGRFMLIAGLYATSDEVWVCDLGLSRIQVFGYDGGLRRTIGSGAPVFETLPTDVQLYIEDQTIKPSEQQRWEEKPEGQRWVHDKDTLFKAADIVVTPNGYWISDQASTSGNGAAAREATCRFYANDGTRFELPTEGHAVWPDYLTADGGVVAFGEDHGNVLWMGHYRPDQKRWDLKRPANYTTSFRGVMGVWQHVPFNSNFATQLARVENASSSESGFHEVGGMTLYQGKLLVCDRQNHRLKIYEARPDSEKWGALLKLVAGQRARDGGLRFDSPRDVAVSSDGLIYVLDGERREVAILAPNLERVGTIAGDGLDDPRALALSPDGRNLFISDAGRNMVHCYAAD
jgi:hypothetical protein